MAEEGWLGRLRLELNGKRVIPPDPPGRQSGGAEGRGEATEAERPADNSASWSTFITYTDAKGEETARVITFRRIFGHFGQPETIHAYCHLRRSYRRFTIANITGMACAVTGEELDPFEHCLALHQRGALKIEDLVLTRMMRILVFMARCDGAFHPLEARALNDLLARYFRFFGGDDAALECAATEVPRLAPTGNEFVTALGWLSRAPLRKELSRFALYGCAAIIEADGVQHSEEVRWALEASDVLRRMATAD